MFKTKEFKKWSQYEKISDGYLIRAIAEIEAGLIDANLGGGLIKKRVAITSSGKSSGARIIIAYKKGNKAFFIHGFKKNETSNINDSELKVLKRFGEVLMTRSNIEVNKSIQINQLYEVNYAKERK